MDWWKGSDERRIRRASLANRNCVPYRRFGVERELATHVGKVGLVFVIAQLTTIEYEVASLPAHAALLTQVSLDDM